MKLKTQKNSPKSRKIYILITLVAIALLLTSMILTFGLSQLIRIQGDFTPSEINRREKITLLKRAPQKQLIFSEKIKTRCHGTDLDNLEIIFSYDDFATAFQKEISYINLETQPEHPLLKFQTALDTKFKTANSLKVEDIIPNFFTDQKQTKAAFNRITESLLDQGKAYLVIESNPTQEVPYIVNFMTGFQAAPLAGSGQTGFELPDGKTFKCGTWIS